MIKKQRKRIQYPSIYRENICKMRDTHKGKTTVLGYKPVL